MSTHSPLPLPNYLLGFSRTPVCPFESSMFCLWGKLSWNKWVCERVEPRGDTCYYMTGHATTKHSKCTREHVEPQSFGIYTPLYILISVGFFCFLFCFFWGGCLHFSFLLLSFFVFKQLTHCCKAYKVFRSQYCIWNFLLFLTEVQ